MSQADGTVDRQQQPPIAPIPEGWEEEGEEDTQQTQQAQQVDSKNGDKQDQHSYEDIVEDMGEIHMEHDWVQFVDEESGYPYWYNTKTQETTWEEPIEDFHIDESAAHLIQKDSANSANTPREGFICPKCMLEFNTQELLVQHCKTCTATRTDQAAQAAAAANGPQTRAPVMNIATKPPKPQSIADRLFGYFGGKKDDDEGWTRTKFTTTNARAPTEKENVPVTPRAMTFGTRDDDSSALEMGALRREVAAAEARERETTRLAEELKRQNLALQKRQVAREAKASPEMVALVDQLRAQVEALMSEKSSLTHENKRLQRENRDLHAFIRTSDGDEDDGDESTDASSDLGNLSPEEVEKLEREIAEMEASLENSTLDYASQNSSMESESA